MDIRPPLEAALAAFGLDATVTPPGEAAVETRAIWLPPRTADLPAASDLRRAEARRVLALPLDGLPAVPRGTIVSVPEAAGLSPSDWRIDEADRVDSDHYRAVVVPDFGT